MRVAVWGVMEGCVRGWSIVIISPNRQQEQDGILSLPVLTCPNVKALDLQIGSQLHFSHGDYLVTRCLNSRTFPVTTHW